ncbi:hypothetical protein V5O48_009121 [Marasmius crinis-equi]|uniref:Prolyl 4-hydroxylase alpha subunit Fe(2+) 2OG dioxygenase domain-containing protein n=1 Tax=Marasmius crinis-equi TaxID=585013 RepID=A0ABR3FCN8_9AGAR
MLCSFFEKAELGFLELVVLSYRLWGETLLLLFENPDPGISNVYRVRDRRPWRAPTSTTFSLPTAAPLCFVAFALCTAPAHYLPRYHAGPTLRRRSFAVKKNAHPSVRVTGVSARQLLEDARREQEESEVQELLMELSEDEGEEDLEDTGEHTTLSMELFGDDSDYVDEDDDVNMDDGMDDDDMVSINPQNDPNYVPPPVFIDLLDLTTTPLEDLPASTPAWATMPKGGRDRHPGRREQRAQLQDIKGDGLKECARECIQEAKDSAVRAQFTVPRREVWTGDDSVNSPYTKPLTLNEAKKIPGMQLVEWDGKTTKMIRVGSGDEDCPLVLAGHLPDSEKWDETKTRFNHKMEDASQRMSFPDNWADRRGNHDTERIGVCLGGGQQEPSNLRPFVASNASILKELAEDEDLVEIISYIERIFRANHPKLSNLYRNVNAQLLADDPSLNFAFGNHSSFAACHFNFNSAVTRPHRDQKNLFFGMCCVYSSGNFDYKKGGHLILWDLKIILEFPPGCFVFLPSAMLEHSNVKIQPGERRSSVAMFSASSLFRWVHLGGATEKQWMAQARAASKWDGGASVKACTDYKKSLSDIALAILRD